jgi:hypothetical protein
MTSGLIRRGRHERCISLERWWSPTRSDFYLQKRPICQLLLSVSEGTPAILHQLQYAPFQSRPPRAF